jgi:hypothetical protein
MAGFMDVIDHPGLIKNNISETGICLDAQSLALAPSFGLNIVGFT